MATESVACPQCGKETLVTVPPGQHLLEVHVSPSRTRKRTLIQDSRCSKCGRRFSAKTEFPEKE